MKLIQLIHQESQLSPVQHTQPSIPKSIPVRNKLPSLSNQIIVRMGFTNRPLIVSERGPAAATVVRSMAVCRSASVQNTWRASTTVPGRRRPFVKKGPPHKEGPSRPLISRHVFTSFNIYCWWERPGQFGDLIPAKTSSPVWIGFTFRRE